MKKKVLAVFVCVCVAKGICTDGVVSSWYAERGCADRISSSQKSKISTSCSALHQSLQWI